MDVQNVTTQTQQLRYGKVMVGLSPVPLTMANGNVVLNKIKASKGVLIRNLSEQPVYVGNESVTVDEGFRVDKNNALIIPCDDPEFVFLIAEDADCEVRWILI